MEPAKMKAKSEEFTVNGRELPFDQPNALKSFDLWRGI